MSGLPTYALCCSLVLLEGMGVHCLWEVQTVVVHIAPVVSSLVAVQLTKNCQHNHGLVGMWGLPIIVNEL